MFCIHELEHPAVELKVTKHGCYRDTDHPQESVADKANLSANRLPCLFIMHSERD